MVEARLYCEAVIKKNIYDKDKIKTVIILQFPYLDQKNLDKNAESSWQSPEKFSTAFKPKTYYPLKKDGWQVFSVH